MIDIKEFIVYITMNLGFFIVKALYSIKTSMNICY